MLFILAQVMDNLDSLRCDAALLFSSTLMPFMFGYHDPRCARLNSIGCIALGFIEQSILFVISRFIGLRSLPKVSPLERRISLVGPEQLDLVAMQVVLQLCYFVVAFSQ
jgi:hypothetical protein